MGKLQAPTFWCFVLGFGTCLMVNVLLVFYICVSGRGRYWELSWSSKAAEEAEWVASITCSGHGRTYLDGLVLDGTKQPVCECNKCYGGPNCSQFLPGCPATVDSGNPLFLEPFWMQHAANSAMLVAGWHRLSYTFSDETFTSELLEMHVRKLHATVGNAVTGGRFIVFGVGSAQLLGAAVYALSYRTSAAPPAKVVAAVPFYKLYEKQTKMANSLSFTFAGDTSLWKNKSDNSTSFIEFVTSPNNPDGKLNKASLHGPNVNVIHNHAYYWPHYTAISTPSDEELMLFSMSKLTGHAGSRFGWAVIKDESVYQRMKDYVTFNTIGVSRDTQIRALKILRTAMEGEGKQFFEFAFETMRHRWKIFSNIMSTSKRFSIQELPPQYCTFFKKIRGPTPAYAWVKCEREEEDDCFAVFKAANVIGHRGSMYSAEDRYVRLSLLGTRDDFENLVDQLRKLVSNEEEANVSLFCLTNETALLTDTTLI